MKLIYMNLPRVPVDEIITRHINNMRIQFGEELVNIIITENFNGVVDHVKSGVFYDYKSPILRHLANMIATYGNIKMKNSLKMFNIIIKKKQARKAS